MAKSLSTIFERFWQSCEVITHGKRKNITQIFREVNKKDLRNYRSVNLSSVPSKTMDQMLLEIVMKEMKNKMIDNSQCGFTKGKSCLTNLVAFYIRVTKLVDKGRATDVIHLGLCKVFDTVWHKILVSKLERPEFHGWSVGQ